jgi:hypothetical protein
MLNGAVLSRWLSPGGLMLPDRAEVFIAGIEDEDYKQVRTLSAICLACNCFSPQ